MRQIPARLEQSSALLPPAGGPLDRPAPSAKWPHGTTARPSGVHGNTFARLVGEIMDLAKVFVGYGDDADDIGSEIVQRIWQKRINGQPEFLADPRLIVSFTRTGCVNAVIDRKRKEGTRLKYDGEYTAWFDAPRFASLSPETELETRFLNKIACDVLDRLSPRRRNVFLYVRELGHTQAEAAEKSGESLRSVKRTMEEVSDRLRAAFEPHLDRRIDR
jgi:RNA polymerase sigma factor (sigma-70 family)